MDVRDCGLGIVKPDFYNIDDLSGISHAFCRDGLVFVDGCNEESLVKLGGHFGQIVKPRNETSTGTGVSNIRAAPGLVGKGYSSEELFFHTDRSGWEDPPQILITTLHIKSPTGGESVLVDGQAVINHIRSKDPELYKLITGSKYSSFRADSGSFEPRPIFDTGRKRLRFRFDDGIQLSASLIDRFDDLRSIINSHAFALSLKPRQCYLLDNYRFLHARTSFTGERSLFRVLVDPHPPKMSKLILFDIDGTLCSASALSVDAYYRCVSSLVGRSLTHENTPINLHGVTDQSLLSGILTYHGIPESDFEAISTHFYKAYPDFLADSVKRGFRSAPIPGAASTLQWLTNISPSYSKAKIGLLTGNYREGGEFKLRNAGIDINQFDPKLSSFGDKASDRHGLVREALSAWQEARDDEYARGQDGAGKNLTVDPNDVLLIGDTPLDVQSAKQAGCHVLAVSTGAYSLQQLKEYDPDIVCERLDSSEARDYIAGFLNSEPESGAGKTKCLI